MNYNKILYIFKYNNLLNILIIISKSFFFLILKSHTNLIKILNQLLIFCKLISDIEGELSSSFFSFLFFRNCLSSKNEKVYLEK